MPKTMNVFEHPSGHRCIDAVTGRRRRAAVTGDVTMGETSEVPLGSQTFMGASV